MAVLWIWEIWVGPEGRMGVENAVHGELKGKCVLQEYNPMQWTRAYI